MYTNRLIDEKSPYLLQHAHNPVDWHPWGEAAFEKARQEEKPIFLSIGYSTCHWCHVMERESFESEEIASVLNRFFVPIKVDREERPDVDRIYMTFVQASTGSGGWPMSVWLTPELKPFFGGTYFPPDSRFGRPGFKSVLEYLANAWIGERSRVLQAGDEVIQQLEKQVEVPAAGASWLDESVEESCFYGFRRTFDSRLGGFGTAPKFPRPSALNFLLRHARETGNDEALEMVTVTLREMARGGMNDQLGGGFHRYSVDERWFVPHFEKMLYDQAQLALSYLETSLMQPGQGFEQVARDIFEYVLRDMTHPDGAFYSAEDADSVIDPAKPGEKGEGAFYIWTAAEIESLLDPQTAEWFCFRFGVEKDGNVANDPHGEFTSRNILFQARTITETARHFGAAEAAVAESLDAARATLLDARGKRVHPHLDDKILTSWNGLMISAFAFGAQVLDETRYAAAAQRAAEFVLGRLYDESTGLLLRRYREGEAAIAGFLDDYACFGNALIDLYEAVFDPRYLDYALRVAERMRELFEDAAGGAFFSTAAGDESLVMRLKDDYDGAEPSGNSMAAALLLRLNHLTGRAEFRESVERTLAAFGTRLRLAPVGVPQMVVVHKLARRSARQIMIAGGREEPLTRDLLREVRRHFLPGRLVLLVGDDRTRVRLAQWSPALAGMAPVDGNPAAFVCENFTCQLPVSNVEQLAELLK